MALGQKLGFRFTKAHRFTAAALHLTHEENPHPNQQQHREPAKQHTQDPRAAFLVFRRINRNTVLHQLTDQGITLRRNLHHKLNSACGLTGGPATFDPNGFNIPVICLGNELRINEFVFTWLCWLRVECLEQDKQQTCNNNPKG